MLDKHRRETAMATDLSSPRIDDANDSTAGLPAWATQIAEQMRLWEVYRCILAAYSLHAPPVVILSCVYPPSASSLFRPRSMSLLSVRPNPISCLQLWIICMEAGQLPIDQNTKSESSSK